ncbi:MAG: type II toxin-antitoxin system prevent-host-death family antitoxin [Actinomycetota bacterium]
MEIGVRELKAKLSHYLRLAEKGGTIVVTDRGKPSALLIGINGVDSNLSPLAIRVIQGVQEGWIQPASGRRLRKIKREPMKRGARSGLSIIQEGRK